MDFSYLDLLASTALRENNSSQADSTTTTVDHPQLNHPDSADNEEDDDEADGKTDVTCSTESVHEDILTEEDSMGSVKCGKPKKSSGKSVSIFVRDGKCVGKKIHSGDSPTKEKGSGDVIDGSNSVSNKLSLVRKQQEVCSPNGSAQLPVVPSCAAQTGAARDLTVEGTGHLCNGVNTLTYSPQVVVNGEGKPVRQPPPCGSVQVSAVSISSDPAETRLDSRVAIPSPSVAGSQCPGKGSKSEADVSELEGDVDSASDTRTDPCDVLGASSPTAAEGSGATRATVGDSVLCQKDLTVNEDGDRDGGATLDMVAADSAPPPSCQSSHTAGGEADQGLSVPPPTGSLSPCVGDEEDTCSPTASTTPEDAVETDVDANCDEDGSVVASSCQESKDSQGQNSQCKEVPDQGKGSLGNKDINPPASRVGSILSPPPPPPPPPPSLLPSPVSAEVVLLDHCYSGHSDKLKHSLENTDDSGDAFESADENVSADEIEHRPRSLSVDSVYLQQGQTGVLAHQEGLAQTDRMPLLSPSLSVDSISNDSSMSEHSSATGGQCYSMLAGCPQPVRTGPVHPPSSVDSQSSADSSGTGGGHKLGFNSSLLDMGSTPSLFDSTGLVSMGPKCGKFRIGTFGSFSNSHLDLDKDTKKTKLKIGLLPDSVMKTSLSSPAAASPGSPFPLLQSPGIEWDRSDAGSEAPDDLDSSTTEDKFLSSSHDSEAFGASSSQIWNHPVFHDHDYCCKEISEKFLGKPAAPSQPVKTGKRKYVKKKDRQDMEEEKLKKGKYLKRELLKQDNRFNLNGGGAESRLSAKSSLLAESLTSKPNPVGRPRKRNDKQMDEYDAETGTKMKITGKYQDQYVYYLNKSSHNRRRKLDEKLPPGDKIILPAPKPGDIVVPHLTDADCEAIRFGGRMALLNTPSVPGTTGVPLPHADTGDMDSSIVNTILSMETEHASLPSPLDSYEGEAESEDFGDIEGNLTSEQVKMLIDCLDTYHMETATTQGLDLLTSGEDVTVSSSPINSMAPTTVEEDLLASGDVKTSAGSGTGEETTDSESLPAEAGKSGIPAPTSECQVSSVALKQNGEETKSVMSNGLPAPIVSQPSVEKNLEFLKTPITKSDFFPAVSTISSSCHGSDFVSASSSALMSAAGAGKSEDANETPWIVTVTLYWNDIPAIIINNMPHVRLVDIHRQILPAKDTGILKKRCQLMNIPVSNCSEMQRYFLVQYGRAHNSKSTLVISKDEAQRLISYYAHPPPRNLRSDDATGLRRSGSYAELRSFMEVHSHPNRHSPLAFAQPRKRGGFRRRGMHHRSHNPSPEPLATKVVQGAEQSLPSLQAAEVTSPIKGLRHKKINFREMLRGEDSSPHASPSLDSQVEEDSPPVDPSMVPRGREGKAGLPSTHPRRRRAKDAGDALPAKRSRKEQRRKDESKGLSQTVLPDPAEAEVSVDGDSPDTPLVAVKNKKRSPGSAATGSLGATGRSPKSRFGPIKVNVRSLVHATGSLSSVGGQTRKKNLFGRKMSIADPVVVDVGEEEHPRVQPLRVLRISHQDAEVGSHASPRLLSPMAEVHLDLYKRSASPCVKCETCDKFLSVPGFLGHQHTRIGEVSPTDEDSTEEGGPGQRRRMLVPMNKENISVEEQQLWNEFVALQERLDTSVSVCSMGAYPLTPLSPASPTGSTSLDTGKGGKDLSPSTGSPSPIPFHPPGLGHLPNGHNKALSASDCDSTSLSYGKCLTSLGHNGRSSVGLVKVRDSVSADTAAQPEESPISICSAPSLPISSTHTENEEKIVDGADVDKPDVLSLPRTVVTSKVSRNRNLSPPANIRTSSRKRETKRLYSFEKYEFGGGKKRGGEMDAQDSAEDVPGAALEPDCDSPLLNSQSLHFVSGAIMHQ